METMLVSFPSKHHKCKIVCQSKYILSFTSVKNTNSGTFQEHLKKGKNRWTFSHITLEGSQGTTVA